MGTHIVVQVCDGFHMHKYGFSDCFANREVDLGGFYHRLWFLGRFRLFICVISREERRCMLEVLFI